MQNLLLPVILFLIGSSPQLQENTQSTAIAVNPLSVNGRAAEDQQMVNKIIEAYVDTTGGAEAWTQIVTYADKSISIRYALAHDLNHRLQDPEVSNSDYFSKEPGFMLVKTRKQKESETIMGWGQQTYWSVVGNQLEWEFDNMDKVIIDQINESHSQPYSLQKTLANAPEALSYGGQTQLNGVKVHIILEASPHGNGHFTHYFNVETNLLVANSGLNGSVTQYHKNYQWLDCNDGHRRLVPTRIEKFKGDRLVSVRTTSDVQYNIDIKDEVFLSETYTNKPFHQLSPDFKPSETKAPATSEASGKTGNR